MPSYQPLADVVTVGEPMWRYTLLNGMKENLEILMGSRQAGVHAVTSDSVTTIPDNFQQQSRLSAQGSGFILGTGERVAGLDDYVKVCQDVQVVMADVTRLQTALNSLLNQLRS